MLPNQGVMLNTGAGILLPAAWFFGPANVLLHLFTSDDTPSVGDVPAADYTEASGPNYNPLNISGAFLQFLSPNPPLWAVLDAAFLNVGPLDPGNDTVFGWWIDDNLFGSAEGVYAGRLATPVVLNMAHQSLIFDQIQLPLHDCNTIPFQTVGLLDPWFQTPVVTGVAPANWQYGPGGGRWFYSPASGVGQAGIAGVGSAFQPPNPLAGAFQCALIQGDGTISQTFFLPAGNYQLDLLAAQRAAGGAQTVRVTLGSATLGTIAAWPTNWQLWQSSSFTFTTSETVTLMFAGVSSPPGADDTLFLQFAGFTAWPL